MPRSRGDQCSDLTPHLSKPSSHSCSHIRTHRTPHDFTDTRTVIISDDASHIGSIALSHSHTNTLSELHAIARTQWNAHTQSHHVANFYPNEAADIPTNRHPFECSQSSTHTGTYSHTHHFPHSRSDDCPHCCSVLFSNTCTYVFALHATHRNSQLCSDLCTHISSDTGSDELSHTESN